MSQIYKTSSGGGGGGVSSVTGTNGVMASPTTGSVLVSGINATTSSVGVASFNSSQFTVTAGAVSLKGSGGGPALMTINNISPDSTGNFTLSGTANQVAITGGANSDTISLIGPYTPSTYTLNGILFGNTTSSIQATAAGANGVLITSNANVPSLLANGTAGFVLTANSGAPPSWQAVASSSFTWTDESSAFNAAKLNGYFISATCTGTLPASPSQGDTIIFVNDSLGTLTIQANTGQVIQLGSVASASAGTAVSSTKGDSVSLVYRTSGTTWIATSAIGNWSIT